MILFISLTLNYDAVNETNTFTSGNVIQGRVFLEVTKAVKVSCFYIKCKGDADVSWETGGGDSTSYHNHVRYFKLKHIFINYNSTHGKNEICKYSLFMLYPVPA
uniref:Arrestin-like N-terminal domain-containing protein n=1 Tax=Pygocentrus nattereri TaxID=42514 RepID=A0A3B4C6E4_PYGNA